MFDAAIARLYAAVNGVDDGQLWTTLEGPRVDRQGRKHVQIKGSMTPAQLRALADAIDKEEGHG